MPSIKRRVIRASSYSIISVIALYFLSPPNPQPGVSLTNKDDTGRFIAQYVPEQGFCSSIYRRACESTSLTRDPTGVVFSDAEGEIQALRVYEQIIRKNPSWDRQRADDELVRTIYTPKQRSRVHKAFRWVMHEIELLIERQPESIFTTLEKHQLKGHLKKVDLQLPSPTSLYKDEPDLYTKNDVFYERTFEGKTRLRVGGAYLMAAKSWFNMVYTVAHELAHSIDPCEMRSAHLSYPAYDRLGACFLQNGLIEARKMRLECGENDQLSETFADWVAAQIAARALSDYATEFHKKDLEAAAINSVKDLCDQEEDLKELDVEHHPHPRTRIEEIFSKNPRIHELFGCPDVSGPAYCSFEWVAPPSSVHIQTEINRGQSP